MNSNHLNPSEFNSYYLPYISILGKNACLLNSLEEGRQVLIDFIGEIPEEKLNHSYADGKWTVAEVLLHLLDTERIFQYRALRFARNDTTEVPSFDQDFYVPNSNAAKRNKKSIIDEFKAIRDSSISLFQSLDQEELQRVGSASSSPISVRALGFIISGHQKHHKQIIETSYL